MFYKIIYINDLDNTIIDIDSDYEWNLLLCKIYIKKFIFFTKNINFLIYYDYLRLNIFKYIKFSLKFFKNINYCLINKILILLKKYLKKKINFLNKNIIKKKNYIIISSATNEIIVKNLIKTLNINFSNNTNIYKLKYKNYVKYNNNIIGIINYKNKKIINKDIIINNNKKKIKFRSDSKNDLFFIRYKINYKIINPDKILFNLSISNNKETEFVKFYY